MAEMKKWNLKDLEKNMTFEEMLVKTRNRLTEFGKGLEKLDPEMEEEIFRELMEEEQRLEEDVNRIMYLPHLMESTDQKDPQAILMKSRANDIFLEYSQTLRPLEHWIKGMETERWKRLDDGNAKRLFATIPDLEHGWWRAREAALHTLPTKEEEIIVNKDVNGIDEVKTLRGLIEADFKYKFKPKGGKQKTYKNQSELMKLVHSEKPEIREAAYRAMLTIHKNNIEKFFIIYQSVVKDWGYEAKLRKYKSPISVRNFGNEIPDETIETLLEVCRAKRGIFQRYFKYKAKKLKTKKLRRFDIYAPIRENKKEYSWEETKDIVLEVYKKFSPEFYDAAEKIIKEEHVDVFPAKNKRSGAFCATVGPKITPYVLLNHTGSERDVSTAAHELGHGIHSILSSHLHIGSQGANLPLAETASTLGETLLFEELLQRETDPKIKESMLATRMADLYASVIRQNYFVIFEKRAHELIAKGVTAEELSNEYRKTLEEQFEDTVEIDPLFSYEWSYIPHIFSTPFYCYAYSFGDLLSLALYGLYRKEGETGKKRIIELLKSGGSEDPMKLLLRLGIDISRTSFWEESFKVIEGWQETLEKLM